MTADNKTYFQPGGSLPADAPTYIIRNADNKLYSLLLEGKFSYVLTARQMGKSSLRVRIANQLSNEGIASVNIDLTNIGSVDTTTDQWYYSLLSRMCRNLDISIKLLRQWWRENQELSPVNRFSSFIEEVLLEETTKPIVIFIDEIDYILSLDRGTFSTDDFFAVIRHCYNSRADNPEYARLTFCLLGVATPNDLMQDPSRTPFNVGYQVELDMLTVESASPLLNGLEDLTIPPLEILPEIISWTGGHPYLTQKICHHIASKSETIKDLADLNNIIQELFLSEDADDHNLKNVNNRILLHKKYNVQMLELLQILFKGKIIESNDKDYTQIYLKLSGLIKISKNKLVVSNKIYQKAFDQKWLNNALAKIKRPFAEDMQRWIDLGKSTSAALRGEVLQHALRWSETRDDLTPNEYEYLSFSRMVQQDEQAKEVELLYADKLKIRNRFLIGALVMSLIAGGAAIYYSFEAKKNERIATSHFQTLKKSLTDLGENDLCHLGIVELFNNDKDLYSTMLTTSVNNALESRFTKLEESIRVSSVMSKDDYSDYIKSIESVKIIIPKKTREQFPDLVNSILASKNMKNQEKNSWLEKLPNMNQSRISELTKILASENSKQKDKKNSSNDKKPNSSKENTEISKKNDSIELIIPEETKKRFPDLVRLIIESRSMDNQERNYWLQVLLVMTESQISELKDILISEKKKLAEIEKKYSKPSFETISKKLETIKKNGNKISLFQIKIYIASINTNNLKKNKVNNFSTTLSSIKSNFINNHEYSFIFSLWLYKQKKYDEAIEYIIKSLDEKPYKIEYLESLAMYYEKSKQFELSREIYNKIFSIFHKYYLINTESNKTKFSLIKTNIKKGNSYYNEERSSEAKEIYYTVFNLTKKLLSKQNSEEDIISYYNDIRKLCVRYNSDIKDMRSLLEQEKILLLISDKLLTYEHTTDNLRRAYSSYWSAGFYASSINDNGELDKLAVQYTKKAITIVEEILSSTREEKYLLDYSSLLTNLTYNLIDTKSLKEASNIIKRNMNIGTEIQNSFNKTESLAKPYLTLSILNFYQRKFNNSIKFAKKALSLDDNTKSDIDIIIADNYLFTNKYNKAKEIYLDYKDKKYEIENTSDTGKIFNKIILEDFQKYRKNGLIHSNMAKIEDLMDILIEDVQFLLTELGYKPIEINNKLDKQTTTAIQLFQRKQNIKDDGKATPELVNALVAELYKKTEGN